LDNLDSKLNNQVAILICGHGSRNKLAITEFQELTKFIQKRYPNFLVEYGFLEFAKPSIVDALDKLKDLSIKKVIAIPAMLFAAGHVKNDIPSLLMNYSSKTGIEIIYGRELGINNLMISAACERVKDVFKQNNNLKPEESLLVVVGRGSSDPDANSNVSKITRMIVEGIGLGWGETVFSGVTFPLVEPGLKNVVRLGYKNIIVFPYFLFSGVLVTRIKRQTEVNKSRKSRYKIALKKMKKLIDSKKKKEALSYLPKLNSELMKIAKTGVIKKGNATRNVSKITRKINSL